MPLPLIDHIGILVPDLEAAIARWARATGYAFSPIVRYRTTHYIDRSDPREHLHDARISMSREGTPRIELMQVTGGGTHGPAELGVHHFGFNRIEDPEGKLAEFAAMGIGDDGRALTDEGMHLWFTDKAALDGVRLEFVSTRVAPLVDDDGSELPRQSGTNRPDMWAATAAARAKADSGADARRSE